jgi:UDP-N-acetylmuramate: L-alanyl-gamma-D-glutamyl-meso-diaminopimelate ligase
MHIHILGICGTLMGSIALLARQMGHQVSGCDENVYPPMSTQLENAGIALSTPYTRENLPRDADLYLVGNAGLPRGNAAVEAVLDSGLPYTSGAEWLGRYALQGRWVIAVAGTHGKTTTSSMVAWILEYAGLNPGFLIGGIPSNFTESARLGNDPFFVIEADEYDTSYFDRRSKFLHYKPRTVILNNLEYDHADIFPDLAAIQNQFHLLLRSVPGSGLIIHPEGDKNLEEIFEKGCWTPRISFSTRQVESALFTSELLKQDGSHFQVKVDGAKAGIVHWPLTGLHNVENSLAAIAAARHVGVKPQIACEALNEFRGVKRRMEVIYEDNGIKLYDDFAHHPTAISSTLEGLRNQVGDETILAIIEPRSHTMKNGTHESALDQSTTSADRAIWFEPDNLGWDFKSALGSPTNKVSNDIQDIVHQAIEFASAEKPVHIVIMSNGSFSGIHGKLTSALKKIAD